jgi:DNA-binding transcriptional MerR regulator
MTEDEVEKRYYSIGEVATMLQVNHSLIRFWESEFDVLKPKKNKKGDRQFTKQDIETLRLIYDLVKEKGYTLQGARDFIKAKGHKKQEHAEVIASLKKLRTFLSELRRGLDGR